MRNCACRVEHAEKIHGPQWMDCCMEQVLVGDGMNGVLFVISL